MKYALAALALVVSLGACSDDDEKNDNDNTNPGDDTFVLPDSGQMRISGSVFGLSTGGGGSSPAVGAAVRASVDRNSNGRVDDDESVSVSVDDNGAYTVTINAPANKNVVLRFSASSYVTLYRTVRATDRTVAKVDVSLASSDRLNCTETGCANESRSLAVNGLSPELAAEGRTFNPVTESQQFPGRFGDSDGNLLISGVFSHVQLTNADGDEVDTLEAPATLRMQVPRDTWSVMVDITPGNGRIDVPLYAFDDASGEWIREGAGYLEDASGATIAETSLADIRSGSYSGLVLARGEVAHFSYWNVDWPIESHACLDFTVVDSNGNPLVDAIVSFSGETYTGNSDAVALSGNGAACVDVMRSETPGEDVDNDGITGETQRVVGRVAWRGNLYDIGSFDIPTTSGSCGGGQCTSLGALVIGESNRLQAGICEVSGVVRDSAGAPLADATVYAFDDFIDSQLAFNLCQDTNCFFATSGADGSFTVRTAFQSMMSLTGIWSFESDDLSRIRYGTQSRTTCPSGPVTLTLDSGYNTQRLTMTREGNVISWSPAAPIATLAVYDQSGELIWAFITEEGSPVTGPVTFGELPPNAIEAQPPRGTLGSGAEITVFGSGPDSDGYFAIYDGELIIP